MCASPTEKPTTCPEGTKNCGGICIDTKRNHENCGDCGKTCQPLEACENGRCVLECSPGKTICSGSCVDLHSDINNCGECGKTCHAGRNATANCKNGSCEYICNPGWSDLDGDGNCDNTCIPASPTELCNGKDDNCDGKCDESFTCCAGQTESCTTSCNSRGSRTCSNSCSWSSCQPPPEECNGSDDNCDGRCDEGFECCMGTDEPCEVMGGIQGKRTCNTYCRWERCCAFQEICNNHEDDNCDGRTDESNCVYPHITITISRTPATSPSSPLRAGDYTTFYFSIDPWSWVKENVAEIVLHNKKWDTVTGQIEVNDSQTYIRMPDIIPLCDDNGNCSVSDSFPAYKFNCNGINTDHVRAWEQWLEIETPPAVSNHDTFYYQCSDKP